MSDTISIRALKLIPKTDLREVDRAPAREAERKAIRRKVRRCFWTRPFGHKREWDDKRYGWRCVACGDVEPVRYYGL